MGLRFFVIFSSATISFICSTSRSKFLSGRTSTKVDSPKRSSETTFADLAKPFLHSSPRLDRQASLLRLDRESHKSSLPATRDADALVRLSIADAILRRGLKVVRQTKRPPDSVQSRGPKPLVDVHRRTIDAAFNQANVQCSIDGPLGNYLETRSSDTEAMCKILAQMS